MYRVSNIFYWHKSDEISVNTLETKGALMELVIRIIKVILNNRVDLVLGG
jgi:hypothetical protein